ncbi:MAG: long-chain fatty acid--CoA ligase [Verrucomicrobia bacterium]|nr:long-chain fatty acid--CoA ligase [Verrucomicrobiota bacterium]MCH8512969.1 long-chain fatty acid--CoA ligase [Kiritimatiellia bacterium]
MKNSSSSRILAPHLAGLYRQAAERYESLPAFATRKKAREWEPISFRDLYERGRALAAGLIEMGVEAREPVGVFSDNRLEWMIADYGIQLCGAVNTPRGTDVTDDDLIHIINQAGIHVAFVETGELLDKIHRLRGVLPELRELILLRPSHKPRSEELLLEDVIRRGSEKLAEGDDRVSERMEGVRSDDLFALIYTSGTTGKPKGVMLTHANVMSQLEAIPLSLSCTDRVLSILPIWHIFERTFEIYAISSGACNYYTSPRTLSEDLANVEPTFMGSAPRLWETLHHRILAGVKKAHPVRRGLFRIAYFLGHHYHESRFFLRDQDLQMRPPRIVVRIPLKCLHALRMVLLLPWYGFFNAAVLETVRRRAGGSLKYTISGGGALPVEIDQFFNYIGIPVLEGYGLTETSPVLAVRPEGKLVCGTVGPVIPGTELRLVDPESGKTLYPDPEDPHGGRTRRGEVWVRGPQVMKGYYREPELTRKVLDEDGWFHTGDLGMVTFNDALKILGRCKSTIVLSNGENVEPEPIEMRLCQSPYIDQCMVLGQDRKFLAALIVPRLEAFAEAGFVENAHADLVGNERARVLIQKEIRTAMGQGHFKRYEYVREFRLLPEPFSAGEELTNLFKLKRHVIEAKYEEEIAELFSPRAGSSPEDKA